MLELNLLGPFQARIDGAPVAIRSKRARALLAMIALAPGRTVARDRVAALLWPDREETQARASLRQELSALRRALGPAAGCLDADGERIGYCADVPVSADVWWTDLPPTGNPHLLDDLQFGSSVFDDWLRDQRGRHDRRAIAALEAELDRRFADGDPAKASSVADRLTAIDPLNEAAVAARVRLLRDEGREAEAMALYRNHAARLAEELDTEPGAALQALTRDTAPGPRPQPAASAAAASDIFKRPAVLLFAFETLSRGEDDRLLADGLADDLRTTLCYWRWFPVIGPDAIGWKSARDGDLRALAAGVDAAYVVSGTLRKAGDRVRVSVGLTEAATGRSLWSGQFEGELEDIFAFQEDISRAIVAQLEPQLSAAEAQRIARARPRAVAPWQYLAQADEIDRKGGEGYGTPDSNRAQARLMEQALERAPDFAPAHARLGRIRFRFGLLSWTDDREGAFRQALDSTGRAIEIDPDNWEAHAYNGLTRVFGTREYDHGIFHSGESVRLNPSAAVARHAAGCALEWTGQIDRAVEHLKLIFRLNPAYPGRAAALGDLSTCAMFLGDAATSVDAARQLLAIAPRYARGLQRCVASFGAAGETELAAQARRSLRDVQPDFDEAYVRETYPFERGRDLEAFLEALRAGGALD